MKKPQCYTLLLLFVLATSCRTEVPQPNAGQTTHPFLFIAGTLDNRPIAFEAGVERHYNHTQLEKDDFNVYESASSIKLEPCDGCHNYLEITLRDRAISTGDEEQNPDSVFQIASYPFQFGETSGNGNLINIQLRQLVEEGPVVVSHQWSILSIQSSQILAQSTAVMPIFTLPEGDYMAQLISVFNTGCADTSRQRVSATLTSPACTTSMRVTRTPNTSLFFFDTLNTTVPNPVNVEWDIEGLLFTGGSLMFVPDSIVPFPEVFRVKLTVIGASCTAVYERRVSVNPQSFCVSNFSAVALGSIDPVQLGHVRFVWKDVNGFTYGSAYGEQPNWAYFAITHTDTFSTDLTGNETIVAEGVADARLFLPDTSAYKDLRNLSFKLAFPYKGP